MLTVFLEIFSEFLEFSHGKYFCENIEFMPKVHNRQRVRQLCV